MENGGIKTIKPPTDTTENGNITAQEFPALTKEDLEEIYALFSSLRSKFTGDKHVPLIGFETYTGINEPIGGNGGNDLYNTLVTYYQFLYALALTRHPLVKEIAAPDFDRSKFDERTLIDSKIMSGIKILDMGCGPYPVFARCCRALGADVWTVDLIPSRNLYSKDGLLTEEQRTKEAQNHIEVNLKDPQAGRIIQEITKGNFNLITEANLIPDEYRDRMKNDNAREIALPLIKKGGVYSDAYILRSSEVKE